MNIIQKRIATARKALYELLQEYIQKGIPLHDIVIIGARIISSVLYMPPSDITFIL